MIKNNLKGKKGITIIVLVITISILLILSGVIVHNIDSSHKTVSLNNMKADIGLFEDQLFIYYNKYEEIPVTSRTILINEVEYSEIDLSKLKNITINYGKEYGKEDTLTNTSDVYVVNQSLKVYYLKGIKMPDKTYHEN